MVLATSKIYENYQTDIPEEIIKRCNIDKDYVIEWDLTDDGKPQISFRKKIDINDVTGFIKTEEKTDSVKLKKSLYQ